ncbi:MAG: hypothetical protein ACREEV_01075 [Dongiaceae bacterium]
MGAIDVISRFESSGGQGSWPFISKADVAAGARDRIADASKIHQGSSSLCGPTSLLYSLIKKKPETYASYVTQLYSNGSAKIGSLEVKPRSDTRNYKVPKDKIHPVDWMALASLRDSENLALSYSSVDDKAAGITMPGTLAGWFTKAGFTAKNVTNVVFTKSKSDIEAADALRKQGYRVCLFINADMLYVGKQNNKSVIPNHWVVLSGPVNFFEGDRMSLTVFTWGRGMRAVPETGDLSVSSFLNNFYGYVAAI